MAEQAKQQEQPLPNQPFQSGSAHPLRLAVLISGGGTTLQNLIDRIADHRLDAEIATVISSQPGVAGIARAQAAGLSCSVVQRKQCVSREEFSENIFSICRQARADLICLAGFLQLLRIAPDYRHRVLNIHPALIPAFSGKGFYGAQVHQAVLAMGVKVTGCTVHFADDEYDHGPIVLQRVVEVQDEDTVASLSQRVFEAECEAYPEAIRLFGEGRLYLEGNRVRCRSNRLG